jgi:hypothetical protein
MITSRPHWFEYQPVRVASARPADRPFIPVVLEAGMRRLSVPGLLDSGSDSSYMPRGLARRLGLSPSPLPRGAVLPTRDIRVGLVHAGVRVQTVHGATAFDGAPFLVPLHAARPSVVVLGRSPFFEGLEVRFQDWRQRVGVLPRRFVDGGRMRGPWDRYATPRTAPHRR